MMKGARKRQNRKRKRGLKEENTYYIVQNYITQL